MVQEWDEEPVPEVEKQVPWAEGAVARSEYWYGGLWGVIEAVVPGHLHEEAEAEDLAERDYELGVQADQRPYAHPRKAAALRSDARWAGCLPSASSVAVVVAEGQH